MPVAAIMSNTDATDSAMEMFAREAPAPELARPKSARHIL